MSSRSTRLDELISDARARDAEWSVDRSERVREGALRRRDVRVRRDRALRRGLLVAGGAGLMILMLLRAASSAPREARDAGERDFANASVGLAPTAEALAARSMSDAGYARD